jgi:hypothetical protein
MYTIKLYFIYKLIISKKYFYFGIKKLYFILKL